MSDLDFSEITGQDILGAIAREYWRQTVSTAGAWKGNPNSEGCITASHRPELCISDAGGYINKSGTGLDPSNMWMRGRSCFMYRPGGKCTVNQQSEVGFDCCCLWAIPSSSNLWWECHIL